MCGGAKARLGMVYCCVVISEKEGRSGFDVPDAFRPESSNVCRCYNLAEAAVLGELRPSSFVGAGSLTGTFGIYCS